jgi:hypothetical protein
LAVGSGGVGIGIADVEVATVGTDEGDQLARVLRLDDHRFLHEDVAAGKEGVADEGIVGVVGGDDDAVRFEGEELTVVPEGAAWRGSG